jgi:hypothetical protein
MTDPNATDEFAEQAELAPPGIVREFWEFLRFNKKWWLTRIIVVLLLVGFLIFLSGTAVGLLLYPV